MVSRIPLSGVPLPFANSLAIKDENNEVRRQILIDGANIIMGTSNKDVSDLRLLDLLSLVRVYVKHNFEVIVFLSPKYAQKATNKAAIEKFMQLQEFSMIEVPGMYMLDDIMCLEMANVTNGVAISNDRFRDHKSDSVRMATIVNNNSAIIEIKAAPLHLRHQMTSDGHYVGSYIIKQPDHECLFVHRKDLSFEISEEQYTVWSPKRKEKILEKIDQILLDLRAIELKPEPSADCSSSFASTS